ncbi:MAG: hypothetical protein ABFS09_08380 [Thermodesulfobacteriota bacterium]
MNETVKSTGTVKETHDSQADLDQASKLGLGMILSLAGLVGVWSVACMVSALTTQGIGAVVKGFMTAITGM